MDYKEIFCKLKNESFEEIDTRLASWYVNTLNGNNKKNIRLKGGFQNF